MVCTYCGSETRVTNSRQQRRNNQVWRRRKCLNCKSVFTTNEAPDLSSTLFVDINGTPRPFLADMLFTELLLALQDRKDFYVAAREIQATIIAKLLKLPEKPFFAPNQISQTAAKVLRRFDRRAWLRYVAEHPSLQT